LGDRAHRSPASLKKRPCDIRYAQMLQSLFVWISAHPADVPCFGYLADRSGYVVAALVLLSHLAGSLAELLVQMVLARDLASLGRSQSRSGRIGL